MQHAHEEGEGRGIGGGDGRGAPASPDGDPARGANLLGAVALTVSDRIRAAAEAGAGQGGSAPAALISLATYLDGSAIDAVRGPLGLSHSATVRLVDRLVDAGLVRRSEGADRRSVGVELTPEGHRAATEAVRARRAALEEALTALDPGERAELARLHAKVLASLTEGRASAGRICRLCDAKSCGHKEGRCPVTQAADRAEAALA
jgi:MarR family transcriptional regulator, negative regulator of the multidrug operon emrRAB